VSRARVGTCQTCRTRVTAETVGGLPPPRYVTVPCVVCRWPMVLAEPPAEVVHEVVAGSDCVVCRCGVVTPVATPDDWMLTTCAGCGHFAARHVRCSCGRLARAMLHDGRIVFRCEAGRG